jgi:hypothetical protein
VPDKIKFEDWTPPWKDEEFDADKAAKLIFNLTQDKASLQESNQTLTTERDGFKSKVTEFETKDLTEVERLKRENEELKKTPPAQADDADKIRLELALEKGLTATQARRLTGSTREELEADADAYIAEHDLGKHDDGKNKPPPRQPRGKMTSGLGDENEDPEDLSDPAKLIENVPRRW